MNVISENIAQLKWGLYLTDFLDVLIVSVLIYSVFVVLKRTKATMILVGVSAAVLLYFVSTSLNLYLTSSALRNLVSVAIIVIAIIFQSEIRKYFELIGVIGSGQFSAKYKTTLTSSYDELIQACVHMAKNKVGALIIIEGNEDVGKFAEGGRSLDGLISEELLVSLFDPRTDGHDGALIVKNNRIVSFGTHLPLSTNFKFLGKKGTRHSAALGMSELTDSLCIVVSEEKGEISICKNGKLTTLKTFDQLETELNKFVQKNIIKPNQSKVMAFIKENTKLKLAALCIASLAWFLLAYQAGITQKQFTVPIKITEDVTNEQMLVIEGISPSEATITVSARGTSIFNTLNAEDLEIIFDGTTIEQGVNTRAIVRRNIEIPRGLVLENVAPNSVRINATRYKYAEVLVDAQLINEPPEGYLTDSIEIKPNKVLVLVPINEDTPKKLTTMPIDLSTIQENTTLLVRISLENNLKEKIRLENENQIIEVNINVTEVTEED